MSNKIEGSAEIRAYTYNTHRKIKCTKFEPILLRENLLVRTITITDSLNHFIIANSMFPMLFHLNVLLTKIFTRFSLSINSVFLYV